MLKRQPNPFVFRIWEQIPFKFYCETIDNDIFTRSKIQIPPPENKRFQVTTSVRSPQYLFRKLMVRNGDKIFNVIYSENDEECYPPFYMYVGIGGDYISIHQDQILLNRLIGSFRGKPLLRKNDIKIFDTYFNRIVSSGGQLVIITEYNKVIKIE